MKLNTTDGASSYKRVLPFNNGTHLLNKTEFKNVIINECDLTCPTESYSLLDQNDTIFQNDFIIMTQDGITVDTSSSQFQELNIRGNYS
jgi:hypothetical protein